MEVINQLLLSSDLMVLTIQLNKAKNVKTISKEALDMLLPNEVTKPFHL